MSDDPCCKVGRISDKHDIHRLNSELEHRRDTEEMSLRDLATLVNTRILDNAITAVGADVAGDATSVYKAVTGDDVPPERRATVRDQLIYAGVDLSSIEEDFVSHQTVRDHLRDCLEVDTSRTGVETVSEGREVISWARTRAERVVGQTLDRLRRVGIIEAGNLDVIISIRVTCNNCNSSYPVTRFLDRKRCNCENL